MSFKWNDSIPPVRFWDVHHDDGRGREVRVNRSPLDIVKNYGQIHQEDVVTALCRVVAELVEIAETQSPAALAQALKAIDVGVSTCTDCDCGKAGGCG
jgi:hypothetical protein